MDIFIFWRRGFGIEGWITWIFEVGFWYVNRDGTWIDWSSRVGAPPGPPPGRHRFVVLEAIQKNGCALKFDSEQFCGATKNGCSKQARPNRVRARVFFGTPPGRHRSGAGSNPAKNGCGLQFASKRLRDDREVVPQSRIAGLR